MKGYFSNIVSRANVSDSGDALTPNISRGLTGITYDNADTPKQNVTLPKLDNRDDRENLSRTVGSNSAIQLLQSSSWIIPPPEPSTVEGEKTKTDERKNDDIEKVERKEKDLSGLSEVRTSKSNLTFRPRQIMRGPEEGQPNVHSGKITFSSSSEEKQPFPEQAKVEIPLSKISISRSKNEGSPEGPDTPLKIQGKMPDGLSAIPRPRPTSSEKGAAYTELISSSAGPAKPPTVQKIPPPVEGNQNLRAQQLVKPMPLPEPVRRITRKNEGQLVIGKLIVEVVQPASSSFQVTEREVPIPVEVDTSPTWDTSHQFIQRFGLGQI